MDRAQKPDPDYSLTTNGFPSKRGLIWGIAISVVIMFLFNEGFREAVIDIPLDVVRFTFYGITGGIGGIR